MTNKTEMGLILLDIWLADITCIVIESSIFTVLDGTLTKINGDVTTLDEIFWKNNDQ